MVSRWIPRFAKRTEMKKNIVKAGEIKLFGISPQAMLFLICILITSPWLSLSYILPCNGRGLPCVNRADSYQSISPSTMWISPLSLVTFKTEKCHKIIKWSLPFINWRLDYDKVTEPTRFQDKCVRAPTIVFNEQRPRHFNLRTS